VPTNGKDMITMGVGGGRRVNWLWVAGVLGALAAAGAAAILYGTHVPGRSYAGPLEPLTPEERAIRAELAAHVVMLAGTIGERNLWRLAELNAAADYIARRLREMGYTVREQAYAVEGRGVRNVEVELRGGQRAEEIVVIGAHYDSVMGSPGANDNASGVAALLVLARMGRPQQFARTVRYVAFVNEEPPFFQSGQMGSQQYARECRRRGERVVAMMSLESLGYYTDAAGSQVYPPPFSLLYPSTGNFLALVGNFASRELLHRVVATFRLHAKFPSEGAAAPEWIPGIGWSDHWAFWKEGYPAVMVTDTALYRYPRYHTARDTPEALTYERMARVVAGLARVVEELRGSD